MRPGAHVNPEAEVHPTATVMAGATVESAAQIGARAVLFPGAYVGEGGRIDLPALAPVGRLGGSAYTAVTDVFKLPRPAWADLRNTTPE